MSEKWQNAPIHAITTNATIDTTSITTDGTDHVNFVKIDRSDLLGDYSTLATATSTYDPNLHYNPAIDEIYFRQLDSNVAFSDDIVATITEIVKQYNLDFEISNEPSLQIFAAECGFKGARKSNSYERSISITIKSLINIKLGTVSYIVNSRIDYDSTKLCVLDSLTDFKDFVNNGKLDAVCKQFACAVNNIAAIKAEMRQTMQVAVL